MVPCHLLCNYVIRTNVSNPRMGLANSGDSPKPVKFPTPHTSASVCVSSVRDTGHSDLREHSALRRHDMLMSSR